MPELPEVETTRRGIAQYLLNRRIENVVVRNRALRYPVPRGLARALEGALIRDVSRRGKYLLLTCDEGVLLVHLGMSGSLRVIPASSVAEKHDHIDFVLDDGQCLRYRDPRRFGSVVWTREPPEQHELLRELGPEPLSDAFTGEYLHSRARRRSIAVKPFLMDSKIVVGVGNIYANEALYAAGIRPTRAASRVSLAQYDKLVGCVKAVLSAAIEAGGTTLRDFTNPAGRPGYFRHALQVYGRDGAPCYKCGAPIKQIVIGQRATYYCPHCQR